MGANVIKTFVTVNFTHTFYDLILITQSEVKFFSQFERFKIQYTVLAQ